ncbi:immune inhibitor A domain-containing protein [Shewanella mangrovisoli]|uniref:immune inhibitor A domain-containing protein n=1 Tax=Shewanella mangrovisoli TaxID=2864211 RepID=UPI001C6557BA|nr:immune inhibitor A domain-containing protein [Shewanella mangrovisoli]QYK09290.1 immune inhibitor A [Shewanella mangrovisoli]
MRSSRSITALGLMLALLSGASIAAPNHTPADAGVINKERILYWLIKRGEVSADASDSVKQAAVEAYIARASLAQPKEPRMVIEAEHDRLQKAKSTAMMRASAQRVLADADVTKTVKVLTVLIDFPDLKYNNNGLTASDTDMYYPSYPASHYKNLLFSTTGFNGPQGQTLDSAYQYYQAVSGKTFFFTGDVKGWYTASQNADYYGANDADTGSDANVTELVKEAVSQAVANMSAAELATYDVEDPYDFNDNGNLNEPDGIIDHVMIFHSSIGEETGGGKLGDNAIWSHRYYVDQSTQGYSLPGSSKKLFGYTIQPIDAATGVCTHEFGHDLGLPDEYDTTDNTNKDGSPVGFWSLMSGGSWTGALAGTKPSGFSPYARSYLQKKYKGKWLNEREISLDSIPRSGMEVTLNQASNQDLVNQVSIPLPAAPIAFKAPYQGSYQYYSGQGDMLSNSMSFTANLPATSEKLTLTMQASWEIEADYDYMQVKVNGVAMAGNYTKSVNAINSARHIITGKSSSISTAVGSDAWVGLEYDLSAYAGKAVTIEFTYVTDEAAIESGITIDNISIKQGATELYADNAEIGGKATLAGYSRITSTRPGAASRYLIQLRSHNGVDAGLKDEGFDPGVLLWLEDFSYQDNNVSDHPGHSLIGVIDADQNRISAGSTDVQIRDAAFSTVRQTAYKGDTNLSPVSLFDDSLDYSAPLQPQAGMVLQKLGLTMQVVSQASDNSTAVIRLANANTDPGFTPLTAAIDLSQSGLTATVAAVVDGGEGAYTYAWDFGVAGATSTSASATYTYANAGTYTLTLTVTDAKGASVTVTKTLVVSLPLTAGFSASANQLTVNFSNTSAGGVGSLSYTWNFGDGTSSTSASPTHTYTRAGTYTVTLTVKDTQNATASSSSSVTVTAPTTPAETSSGGGGGSLGWLSLMLLGGLAWRRQRQ